MPKFTKDEISYHARRAEEEAARAMAVEPGMHVHSELARIHRVRSALIAAAISASEKEPAMRICRTDKEG
jgi:hypothetical protein